MMADWSPLRGALRACAADRCKVPIWWRDDDAAEPTKALDELTHLAQDLGVPVHLAVIPATAKSGLVGAVDPVWMRPVVHGWAHANHSDGTDKKNEFLTDRPGMVDEAAQGLQRLRALFSAHALPMFVPPWNRMQDALLPELAAQGYAAVSTFGPRKQATAAAGLTRINTHVDPIWWKKTRDLVAPEDLIAQTAAHLEARRLGREDAREPLGFLTHHLVHSPAIWDFTRAILSEMLDGGATLWTMETDHEPT